MTQWLQAAGARPQVDDAIPVRVYFAEQGVALLKAAAQLVEAQQQAVEAGRFGPRPLRVLLRAPCLPCKARSSAPMLRGSLLDHESGLTFIRLASLFSSSDGLCAALRSVSFLSFAARCALWRAPMWRVAGKQARLSQQAALEN